MKNIYSFVCLSCAKRKAVWIALGVFWLFILLIVDIVPAILKYDPLFIWNNTFMDVSSYSLIIVAVCCSILAVYIFREYRDDGTELVIVSKPIKRWKILTAKVLVYLTMIGVMIISNVIFFCFAFCFGSKTPSNITGVNYHTLGVVIGTFILGTFITSLFFGSVAILISLLSGKITMMVGTIGLSVVINVIYMIMPILAIDVNDYVYNKYGNEFISVNYVSLNKNKQHLGVTMDYLGDHNLQYYVNEVDKHNNSKVATYFNIAQQMSGLYKAFGAINQDAINNSGYGQYANQRYSVDFNKKILEDQPMLRVYLYAREGITTPDIKMDGMYLDAFNNQILSLIGVPSNVLFWQQPSDGGIAFALKASNITFYTFDQIATHPITLFNINQSNGKTTFTFGNNNLLSDWINYINKEYFIVEPVNEILTPLNYKNNIFGKFNTQNKFINNFPFKHFLKNEDEHGNPLLPNHPSRDDNLARALLGHDVQWNNIKQATDDINLCAAQLKWIFNQMLSRMFYELWAHYCHHIWQQDPSATTNGQILQLLDKNSIQNINVYYECYRSAWTREDPSMFVYKITDPSAHEFTNDETLDFKNASTHLNDFKSFLNLHNYSSLQYISNEDATIFWSCFSFIIFIVAIVIYSRTDFK